MLKRSLLITLIALPLAANAAHAQFWDSPLFYSPKPMDDIGVYFVKKSETRTNHTSPSGLKAIWRQTGNINLGVHAGVGDLNNLGDAVMLGFEAGNLLKFAGVSGVAMAWSVGAGATFGKSHVDFSVPVGLSAGLNLGAITPYVQPRISYDLVAVDDNAGQEHTYSDIGIAIDLGAEVSLGRSLILRAAYTTGPDNDLDFAHPSNSGTRRAFGIGAALSTPRKVVARGR